MEPALRGRTECFQGLVRLGPVCRYLGSVPVTKQARERNRAGGGRRAELVRKVR